jgi:hypothetical protein
VSFWLAERSPNSISTLSNLCQHIQDMALSRAISESTWGYPLIGALHVLAMALFGGTVLISNFSTVEDALQLRKWKWFSLVLVMLTGMLLFASNAVRYYDSVSFKAKLILLVLAAVHVSFFPRSRRRAWISAALLAAVIFASRGIAFF